MAVTLDPRAFAAGYIARLRDVLALISLDEVASFIRIVVEARDRGAMIFFLGNGGSAATASHFANDVAVGGRNPGKPFRAMSLTDNVAVLTAVANDRGYDRIFIEQLEILMQPGDVVVAISASGNSPNVLRAVEYANASGITVGLTGFDGGKLRQIAQYGAHVPTEKGAYGLVEDAHMALDHLLGAYLIEYCRAESV